MSKKKRKKGRSWVALAAIISHPSAGAFRNKKRDKKLRRRENKGMSQNHHNEKEDGGFLLFRTNAGRRITESTI